MSLPLPTQDERSMHLRSNGKSCKRLHSESYSLDEPSLQSAKKQKLSPPARSQSPSAFWDNLSRQHLIDHGIYPHAYEYPDGRIPPKPNNWEDIKERLARPRASLSPSKFTEAAHEKFVRADANAFKERQITESVTSMIEGDNGDVRCVSGGVTFGNFDPLTDGTLKPGNPDRFYGARPEQLRHDIRSELSGRIKPLTQDDLPILPNFPQSRP
ncbi:hypothetical protein ZTR_10358 [Talaromyces verruculosus]|nr:hypothetical protein ZTR_10358 [Talaromyces verruculosus]